MVSGGRLLWFGRFLGFRRGVESFGRRKVLRLLWIISLIKGICYAVSRFRSVWFSRRNRGKCWSRGCCYRVGDFRFWYLGGSSGCW